MKIRQIEKLRYYFMLFDVILGIVSSSIIYLFYLYIYILIKLTYYTIVLRLVLIKHRLPRKLRKKIVWMYEEKLTKLLSLDLFENIPLSSFSRKRKRVK
ncbi:MAG: hypothetical protein J7J82_08635 [Staphylothermus sp.]|nr:hypothetical protein [Staphylothermus sp.]